MFFYSFLLLRKALSFSVFFFEQINLPVKIAQDACYFAKMLLSAI